MRYRHAIFVLAFFACMVRGQTRVDLRTQSKSVDFTAANMTKPFKSGTVLPGACTVGEAFFKTDAPAGTNLYACTSLNSWTLETGGTTGASFAVAGPAATISFPSEGSNFRCGNRTTTLLTPATVTLGSASAPAGSQAWVYFDCGSSALRIDTSASMNQSNITVTGITKGLTAASGFPNDVIPIARLSAGNDAVNQWDTYAVTDGYAFQNASVYKAGSFLSRTANADGSMTLALDSTKLGNASGSTLATVGTVGSASAPACWDSNGNVTSTGCTSGGGVPSGSSLPATCTAGSMFLLTGAPFGQNLYSCLSTNNWSVQGLYGPTVWYYQQYFCPDSLSGGGYGFGTQRWPVLNGQAVFTYVSSTDFSHQCGIQIATNPGTAGNNGLVFGDQGTGGAYMFSGLNSLPVGASLQFYFRFKVSSVSQNQVILRLSTGGQDLSIASGVDSVGFFLDSSQGVNPSNLRFQTCSNGSCTNTDTGVAIIPGEYYTTTATTSTSGTWAWSIRSSGGSQSGSQSTNAPSGPMRPGVSIKTLDTNSKSVTVNRFEALSTGQSAF